MANKLLVMSEYRKAEDNFRRAAELFEVNNDKGRVVECKLGLATIKFLEGDYGASVKLYESLRNNESITLSEIQREAIKSSISICKELINNPLKH